MTTPRICQLGHVGVYVDDLAASKRFYRDVLGLEVTDEDDEHGLVFLSSRPDEEHHELVLCRGRRAPEGQKVLQQVSFRCQYLEDVVGFFHRFREEQVAIQYTVTHGNAIGIYFYDPDGNRCEVYWQTGMVARQAFRINIDLDKDLDALLDEVAEYVTAYGTSGFVQSS